MKIVMMTNTYWPHVGGVARSVESFCASYRRKGHEVLIVAPSFEGTPAHEANVVRLPALQNFNGSDFSVALSATPEATERIDAFNPDIFHAHHPFLLGSTAVRMAARLERPLVFTHHTMYEKYTHYVPGDSEGMKRFVIDLSTYYANLADMVFAPSHTIAEILKERGVTSPVEVVPTGVRREKFKGGDGRGFCRAMGMPADATVIGHLGRLAAEKNIHFLARGVLAALRKDPDAVFLVVGSGTEEEEIRETFEKAGMSGRLFMAGTLQQPLLTSAYRAMDVFAFASLTETQGMVLTEAMATGTPVVALDAPGGRDVVRDGLNGRLLSTETSAENFGAALLDIGRADGKRRADLEEAADRTAELYSMENTADKALSAYEQVVKQNAREETESYSGWVRAMERLKAEWEIARGMVGATGAALSGRKKNA